MNVQLLREIQVEILAKPDAFRMDVWTCGTAHCIAGWALHLTGQRIADMRAPTALQTTEDGRLVQHAACDALQIDEDEGGVLFNTCKWPDYFRNELEDDDGDPISDRQKLAKVAAERIDFFIIAEGR